MPPLPFTANAVKCRLLAVAQSQNVDTVLHFAYTGGPATSADLSALAGAVAGQWGTSVAPFLHTSYALKEVVCTDLTSATAAEGSATSTVTGGDASAVAPLSVCAVVSWKIARRYRGGKPRTYLSPVGANTSVLGKLIPVGQATAIANGAEDFRVNINLNVFTSMPTVTLGTVSYRSGNVLRAAGLFEPFIAGTNVDLRLGSQRRRLGKLSATREV